MDCWLVTEGKNWGKNNVFIHRIVGWLQEVRTEGRTMFNHWIVGWLQKVRTGGRTMFNHWIVGWLQEVRTGGRIMCLTIGLLVGYRK